MWIFRLESPRVDSGFHNTQGVLYPKTQPNRFQMWVWHILVEARTWTWISTTHTDLSLHDTPKPGVPRVHWLHACVCMPLY